jgi:hypothetical protein
MIALVYRSKIRRVIDSTRRQLAAREHHVEPPPPVRAALLPPSLSSPTGARPSEVDA